MEDLEDHLINFYDVDKLSQVKDNNIRLTKAFKLLKMKLKFSKIKESEKENEDNDNDDEEQAEEQDSLEEPVELPNGELLLQNGKVLGNKYYQIYYKQRVKLNRFEGVMSTVEFERKVRKLNFLKKMANKGTFNKSHFKRKITDKKKNIMRQNTLFKSRKQVNV